MTEIINHDSPDFFCSLQSRAFEESTMGSAPSANVWFMLEYNGRWGTKALKESSISDEVKAHLDLQLDSIEKSRLLLIKQKKDKEKGVTFFAAVAMSHPPKLYRFELHDYDALLDINFNKIVGGDSRFKDHLVSEPLFLVCTNGLRDKCCARNGVPTYAALSQEFGDAIWQSSHHGGHRFSANMLAMPFGLSYGRMDLGGGRDTIEAFMNNEMPLENLRGRSNYVKVEQAAEALLRAEIDEKNPLAFQLKSSQALNDEHWEVNFEGMDSDKIHSVRIQKHESDTMAYISCNGDKQAPVVNYTLLDHSIS